MHAIISQKPYRFVPPHRGNWIPSAIQSTRLVDYYLSHYEGIESHEVRGAERVRESLRRNAGILLAPNHCRYADPVAMGWLSRASRVHLFSMASWHLFTQHWLQSLAIRLCGGFSIYREGMDRKSLETAVEILSEAVRPLVLFPEGTVFRSNDVLQPLLEGVAFIARAAAKRREKRDGGKVVVHPIAIKYLLRGDVREIAEPAVARLEDRLLSRRPYTHKSLVSRVQLLCEQVLTMQEVALFGRAQPGTDPERRGQLIEALLSKHETTWLHVVGRGELVPRIKQLRLVLVPELQKPGLAPAQSAAIWEALTDIYNAQQIASYPAGYLDQPTDTRLIETVERLEEDVLGRCRVPRPLHAVIQVGEAIVVQPSCFERNAVDPLLQETAAQLRQMLAVLSAEARPMDD